MTVRRTVLLYNPKAAFHTMPLALVALGSMLDRNAYSVKIVDGRLETDPVGALRDGIGDALCLGVTVLSGAPIRDALNVSRSVKAIRADLPVIWGGWHPSLFPSETLDEPAIDACVSGQGEPAFERLVRSLARGTPIGDIPGLTVRTGAGPATCDPDQLADPNTFPPADYELIPVERYFAAKGRRQLDYVTSMGCNFRCAFCADPFVHRRRRVARSPERVVAEVEDLWRRYRFEDLSFQDENLFTHPAATGEMARGFVDAGLVFTWTGTMRADQCERMTDDDLAACVRSGLRRLLIGAESGSQAELDRLTKDTTVAQVLLAARRCREHGIGAQFPFILGLPGESEASVRATLDLAAQLRAVAPEFETPLFYFRPYPGSRIAAEAEAHGYRQPRTLEAWADFDYVDSRGPWVDAAKYRLVERFKFYNRAVWSEGAPGARMLRRTARWRCRHHAYGLPVEKWLAGRADREGGTA